MLEELRQRLVASRNDPERLRDTIGACAPALQDHAGASVLGLANDIVALAVHSDERVRMAIAQMCDLLPDTQFDAVFAMLANDRDDYVGKTARHASMQRTRRKRADERRTETKAVVTDLLGEFEVLGKRSGKRTRRMAERLIRAAVADVEARFHHEIHKARSPLVRAAAELTSETGRPQPRMARIAELAGAITAGVERETALLAQSRPMASVRPPEFREVALRDIVMEAVRELRSREASNAGAPEVHVELEVDSGIRMDLDRHALLQALANVTQNAVEAYPPGAARWVRVTARVVKKGTWVELAVADKGCGMDVAEVGDAWGPAHSSKRGGLGFGLLVVRRAVMDMHGGEVALESESGSGTTVTLRLPVRQG